MQISGLSSGQKTYTFYDAQVTLTNSTLSPNLVTLDGITTNSYVNTLALYNAQATLSNTNVLGNSPVLSLGASTLTISNNLTVASSSVFNFALGTNSTTVGVSSNLVLSGTLNIADGGGFTSGSYPLFTYGTALTTNNLSLGSTPVGYSYSINTSTSGQVNLAVTLLDTPPEITSQPENQTNVFGSTASFDVAATGEIPLSYQWYFNTNIVLTDETNSTLTLNNIQYTDGGDYTVVITNDAGSVTSVVATLTVTAPVAPSISTQPSDQTGAVGRSAQFTVVADGTPPLSYQWYFNTNTPVAGATDATLTLNNLQTTNPGGYSVIITNYGGSVTSAVVTLTVIVPTGPETAVLLDDTFATGTRNNQNLPTNSAWYVSKAPSVTTTTGSMTFSIVGSFMGITYFGTNSTSPVQLGIGETLAATITFTFNGVSPENTSHGFTLGLFDFADSQDSPTWVTADGFSTSSQGSGVQGYALFQNMGVQFNNATPMDVRKRNPAGSGSLLGTSSDFTSLGTGPGNTNNFSGFANGTPYTLQLALDRTGATNLLITMIWSNTVTSATLVTSETDNNATNFNFDGIAIRPSTNTTSSTNITLNEVKVELTSGSLTPSITTQPLGQTVNSGDPVTFTVAATGVGTLTYQWQLFRSDLVDVGNISGSTSNTLTLSGATTDEAGDYSVLGSGDMVSTAFLFVCVCVCVCVCVKKKKKKKKGICFRRPPDRS